MTVLPWQRAVFWGPHGTQDSFRHIYADYMSAFNRMGVPAVWLTWERENRDHLQPGDLVFCFDMWGRNLDPAVDGVDYCLHNFDAAHPLVETLDPTRLVRLQVYTNDAHGEQWGPVRLYEPENHVLFQPWGTDLFAEEFHEPVFNPSARECAFVGCVWEDPALGGNKPVLEELGHQLSRRGLRLTLHTQIPAADMVRLTRESRFAPALTGRWQVEHQYLPCRVFKSVSYGCLAVTNVPKFRSLFANCTLAGDSPEELVDEVLALRRSDYLGMVRAQQRVVADYTYRQSVEQLAAAFERARR